MKLRSRGLLGELSAEFLGTFVILIFGIGVGCHVFLFPGVDRGGYVAVGFAWASAWLLRSIWRVASPART